MSDLAFTELLPLGPDDTPYRLLTTEGVSTFEAATSLIVLTSLYALLAVVEIKLLVTYIRKGADPFVEPPDVPVGGADDDRPLTFAY